MANNLLRKIKISFFKRYADPDYVVDWKFILDTYLKPFGGPYILRCNYDLSYLSIRTSSFHEDCLRLWTKLNAPSFQDNEDVTHEIVWNNKNIHINNKSIYSTHLIDIGIHRVGDMLIEDNNFLTWYDLKAKGLQSQNFLFWQGIVDAIPTSWKQALKTGTVTQKTPFDPSSFTLPLNSVKVDLLEVNTKKVYAELVSKLKERPTAQIRFEETFPEHNFDWKKIVKLPFQVALDTHTCEFQYKLLNRILFTNSKLFKIGLADSPLCTFCEKDNETPEHLFLYCHYANSFWTDISTWLKRCNRNIDLRWEIRLCLKNTIGPNI